MRYVGWRWLVVAAGVATAVRAEAQEPAVLIFPDAHERPSWAEVHRLAEARRVADGRGVRVGILDHGFGMDAAPDLYADGVDLLGNGALSAYAEHGYWMALTLREIAPGAEIVALNTASRDPMESAEAISRAIDWAIDHGIHILTYSHAPFSEEARAVVDPAIERAVAHGILPVFIHYPHELSLFPTGMWDRLEAGIGTADLNVLHYDYKVLLTALYMRALAEGRSPREAFLSVSSTAPVAAGVAALMLELAPTLGPAEVKAILVETAYTAEFEGETADRVLDAAKATEMAAAGR